MPDEMKKLTIVSIIFCMMAIPAMVQGKTPIGGGVKHGVYGGPALKVTQLYDGVGVMIGGRVAWVINRTLSIGAGGYGQVNNNIDAPIPNHFLSVGYGGGVVEFIILPDRPTHLSVSMLIGVGGVDQRDKDTQGGDVFLGWHNQSDGFFVVEPGVDLVLKVTESFRLGLGVSYRHFSGVDSGGLSDSDISGLSATVTFRFGGF
jgi:hypothetical protein